VMTSKDEWWNVLIDALSTVGHVEDRVPRGLVVTVDRADGRQVVEIDITPKEWEEFNAMSWGVISVAADHVREQVAALPRSFRVLTYVNYKLEPSNSDWDR
jgi:ribosomal protein L16 Arg81 hydroxylase